MPTLTVPRTLSVTEVVTALKAQLGSGYDVAVHGAGADEAIRVKQSVASTATVRLEQVDSATTLRVHAGGFIISRLINELGIAKKVTVALRTALGPVN